jgi:hypothetical protein
MSRAGRDGPEDVDATFAEIVADLRAQGFGDTTDDTGTAGTPGTPDERPVGATPAGGTWRSADVTWDETMLGDDPADDDEHYVPPEPPPLPKPRKGAVIVLLFFVVGLLLLVVPSFVGLSTVIATPLGMLALATGLALLLLRVKQGPPDGADPSNGAQV